MAPPSGPDPAFLSTGPMVHRPVPLRASPVIVGEALPARGIIARPRYEKGSWPGCRRTPRSGQEVKINRPCVRNSVYHWTGGPAPGSNRRMNSGLSAAHPPACDVTTAHTLLNSHAAGKCPKLILHMEFVQRGVSALELANECVFDLREGRLAWRKSVTTGQWPGGTGRGWPRAETGTSIQQNGQASACLAGCLFASSERSALFRTQRIRGGLVLMRTPQRSPKPPIRLISSRKFRRGDV